MTRPVVGIATLAGALALAACAGPNGGVESNQEVGGKADDPAAGADPCPGPYEGVSPSSFFQGLRGQYLRVNLLSANAGDLLSASFTIDPPSGSDLSTGTYAASSFGTGAEQGAFQEAESITVPAFLLVPAGKSVEQSDGYIVVKASVQADGTLSRLCVQRLLHTGVSEVGTPFELHHISF